MTPPLTPIQKYRPSLTAAQIAHILRLSKLHLSDYEGVDRQDIDISKSVIKTLAPFLAKIQNYAIEPAFTTSPKLTTLELLGEVDSTRLASVDKIARNQFCYNLYLQDPNSCDLSQIAAAKEHMYVNDLMTPEEEAAYEADMI